MLCYSCIVQLNMAYNFKNIVVETHLYLDRFAIENGLNINGGETMTGSIIDEDQDQASIISSIRDEPPAREEQTEMPPPPPVALAATTTRESPTHNDSSQNNESMTSSSTATAPTTTDELGILEENQIKTEPWDEDAETILRAALMQAREEGNLGSIGKRKSDPRPATEPPKKIRVLNNNNTDDISPSKRPMVAVPRDIVRNSKHDKEYLEKILRRRVAQMNEMRLRRRRKETSSEEEQSDTESEEEEEYKGRSRSILKYDLANSTFIKELLSDMPKQRLRARRSSIATTTHH